MIQGNFLKIPQINDRGTVFCPAISESLTILDGHTHDGANSPKISANQLTKAEIVLPSSGWVSTEDDFKQVVTLPSGYQFDTCQLRFLIHSGSEAGSEIHPTVIKKTVNSFEVYIMVNTFDLKVVIA